MVRNQATITVPLGEASAAVGYEIESAEAGRITANAPGLHLNLSVGREQAIFFSRIRAGLREQNATLPDGRPVFTNADVVRWLLSQHGDPVQVVNQPAKRPAPFA